MKSIFLLIFFSLSMAAAGQAGGKNANTAPKPFILGQVNVLHSAILGENRTLNIYLPEGYTPADSVKYPVIYLLDGSANEDFIHIAGIVQYYSFDWIQVLQPSIVVGIANVDRRRDFTFPTRVAADKKNYPTTGQSKKFIAFIQEELQPYIAGHYKTSGQKTLIGQSLGGLLATEILIEKPILFDRYIIVSPSLWWDHGSLLEKSLEKLKSLESITKIYIAVGKEGLTGTTPPRVMEVDANMLADKIAAVQNKNIAVFFDYLPQEDHATIMHQAVLNAFKQLSSKNKLQAIR